MQKRIPFWIAFFKKGKYLGSEERRDWLDKMSRDELVDCLTACPCMSANYPLICYELDRRRR